MKDEFVMVPRDWAESVVAAGRGEPVRQSDVELLSTAVKAQQHQSEPVVLPERKAITAHGLTALDSEADGWNACLDEIAKLGPLYARPIPTQGTAKPVGEVVGRRMEKLRFMPQVKWADDAQNGRTQPGTKLYSHADPAEVVGRLKELVGPAANDERIALRAEVERLTRKCQNADLALAAQTKQVHNLRGQLSEAHALLRHLYENNELSLGDDQRILSALSASAELSAPKHETCKACHGEGVIHTGLEESPTTLCKRCDGSGNEPSAPVEISGTPKQAFSAHEFVLSYCRESGISEDDFYESEVPMPSQGSPHGWAAVSNHPSSIKAHVKIHLSGGAEPIEIDEQAAFDSAYDRGELLCTEGPYDNPRKNQAFSTWKARAALERKP